jgi:hypothetical protein
MAIATKPFTLKDTSVTLKLIDPEGTPTAVEYRCQLTRAEFVPADAGGGGGEELVTFCTTHSDSAAAGDATWTLELEGFQSYQDAQDLSMFLFDNEGMKAEATLVPGQGGMTPGADNPGFKGEVTLKPTNIGGTARQYARFTVSLPATQKPTKVTA